MGVGAAGIGAVAGAAALVEYGVVPGRTQAYRVLGLDGSAGSIPDVTPGPVRRGVLDGASWVVCEPPVATTAATMSPAPLPVVLALHGASYEAEDLVTTFGLDRFLAASGQRLAVAAISGGFSYWHPRADGTDTSALVLDRFVPLLAARGYDVDRPGLLGWSMGGYGVLFLATLLRQRSRPVGPVAATSPALWEHWDDVPPGVFDDEQDLDRHGMFARAGLLQGVDLRIDCGRGDPFYRSVESFADRLEDLGVDPDVHVEAGAHTVGYWTRVLPAQLSWLGRGLSAPA